MATNLIVVFGDEMRGQAMGCAGDPNVRTPNMDRMAAEGTMLRRAYTNTPVCTPARGTIITGLFPPDHGASVNDIPIHTDVPSMAASLGEAGYRRAWIGKWHLGGIPRTRFIPPGPERLGFDDYWASWNCHHRYFDAKYFLNDSDEPIFAEGYEPTVQTDLTLGFLEDHLANHADQPFCAFLSWGPPHDPYVPRPPGSEDWYDPDAIELRPNCPDTEKHRTDLAGHYAHITALDAELGRILDFVDEQGLREDTIVVYTSDHGSMLGSQGSYNKQQPWAESINIPFLVWGPSEFQREPTDLLFSLLDFAPTMLGMLGAPIPERMQGDDLSAHILGDEPAPDRSVYIAEHYCTDQACRYGIKPWRGVKTDRYTYCRTPEGPWLPYDDVEDPYQLRNLVDDPAHAETQADLDAQLRAWMDRFNDRLLTNGEELDYFGIREVYEERTEFLYRDRNMSGDWLGDRPDAK